MSLISLLIVTLLLGILAAVVIDHVNDAGCPHSAATTTTLVPGVSPGALDGSACS